MRHLFVINPEAGRMKSKVRYTIEEIEGFFRAYPDIRYDIHVTRWCREALGFVRRYVSEVYLSDYSETVRVHAMGGGGTVYEVLNGLMGLPGVQLAVYPYGSGNAFLRYFGNDSLQDFASLEHQVFSDTIPLDVVCCGHNFGLAYMSIGAEATAMLQASELSQKRFPYDETFQLLSANMVFNRTEPPQAYEIRLDDLRLSGRYVSMTIANAPCYGRKMSPAVDAHPNDGLLHLYLVKHRPRWKLLTSMSKYFSGQYKQVADVVSHYTGHKLKVSSSSVMTMNIDGEPAYGASIKFDLMPEIVDFACPSTIDIRSLPRIYKTGIIRKGGSGHG